MSLWTLDEYAETRVAQRISIISGVAQVQVLGAQKFAVHAQMDPHAMAARGVGINEIETALKNWNVNLPTGTINGRFYRQICGGCTSQLRMGCGSPNEPTDIQTAYLHGALVESDS